MKNMKQFSIVLLMTMFLANTVVVSAWAKPCMMNDMEMTEMSRKADMGEMPCHEENKSEKQDPNNHCEGVCLCLHVSLTQTPVLSDLNAVPDVYLGSETYTLLREDMASFETSPSNPPPKFIS
jgi:hypothetical protein